MPADLSILSSSCVVVSQERFVVGDSAEVVLFLDDEERVFTVGERVEVPVS